MLQRPTDEHFLHNDVHFWIDILSNIRLDQESELESVHLQIEFRHYSFFLRSTLFTSPWSLTRYNPSKPTTSRHLSIKFFSSFHKIPHPTNCVFSAKNFGMFEFNHNLLLIRNHTFMLNNFFCKSVVGHLSTNIIGEDV